MFLQSSVQSNSESSSLKRNFCQRQPSCTSGSVKCVPVYPPVFRENLVKRTDRSKEQNGVHVIEERCPSLSLQRRLRNRMISSRVTANEKCKGRGAYQMQGLRHPKRAANCETTAPGSVIPQHHITSSQYPFPAQI